MSSPMTEGNAQGDEEARRVAAVAGSASLIKPPTTVIGSSPGKDELLLPGTLSNAALISSPRTATTPPAVDMMYRKNFGKTGIYVPPTNSPSHAWDTSATNPQRSAAAVTDESQDANDISNNDEIQRSDLHSVSDEEEADNVITTPTNTSAPPTPAIALTLDRRTQSMDDNRPFDERLLEDGTAAISLGNDEDEDVEPPSLRVNTVSPSGSNTAAPLWTPKAMPPSPSLSTTAAASSLNVTPKSGSSSVPQRNPVTLDAISARDRFNMPPPRYSSPTANAPPKPTSPTGMSSPRSPHREDLKARVIQVRDRAHKENNDSMLRESRQHRARPNHRDSFANDHEPEQTSMPLERRRVSHRDHKNDRKMRESSPLSVRSASVSFDKQKDTVRYYETDDANDSATLADRSLDSEYTKSAESEVEDLIKDIFMLGGDGPTNPGRRKVKYSSSIKERGLAAHSQSELDDEDTYETNDDSEYYGTTRKGSKRSLRESSSYEKDDDDNPLTDVWNYMEGGLKSVGAALGLMNDEPARRDRTRKAADLESNDDTTNATDEEVHTFWLKILGKSSVCAGVGDFSAIEATEEPMPSSVAEEIPYTMSLEEDMRLVDLAMQAARSMHRLKGVEFDESCEIDIANDILFAVVDLAMPFGLIFQENPTGVWVTKVLPNGSAANTKKVKLGDQLAAIDGISAIDMKVDEVSSFVRKKCGLIELTFLRYIGPLRPLSVVEEEGYEVKPAIQTLRTIARPSLPEAHDPNTNHDGTHQPKTTDTASHRGRRRLRLFRFGRHRK